MNIEILAITIANNSKFGMRVPLYHTLINCISPLKQIGSLPKLVKGYITVEARSTVALLSGKKYGHKVCRTLQRTDIDSWFLLFSFYLTPHIRNNIVRYDNRSSIMMTFLEFEK